MTDVLASNLIVALASFATTMAMCPDHNSRSLVNVVVFTSPPFPSTKRGYTPAMSEGEVVEKTEGARIDDIAEDQDPGSSLNEQQIGTDEYGLMWSMAGVRKLFKDHRMWPTFVGPKFLQHGVPRINLPVLLWKEQASYLDINEPSEAAERRAAVKRKYTSSEDEPPVENKHAATLQSNISDEEHTRNLIFEDLHKRNYFVGPADAYGGDYSLYKGGGDPTQTHSIATVRVIEKGHKISARELLAFSRVQNQVAKSAVLAFKLPDEEAAQTEKDNKADGGVDGAKSEVEEVAQRDGTTTASNEKVGYIVINFRNVSDRV